MLDGTAIPSPSMRPSLREGLGVRLLLFSFPLLGKEGLGVVDKRRSLGRKDLCHILKIFV